MSKRDKSVQSSLFADSNASIESIKVRIPLTAEEKLQRQEKVEAREAWKLLKSNKGKKLLTDRQKILLRRHYNISIE